ncbi:anti-ECFsigma factor, ChrR [Alteromonadaceae bacterium Bs31]|nr:anti-ECFsigma factor, ChrR [Alteromonadaceae bacterium Bs31]
MLKHHPSSELLADYASGSMPLSHSLCIATHLEQCDICRQQAHKLNQLGAQFFMQQSSTATSADNDLKAKVMGCLDEIVFSTDESASDTPKRTAASNKVDSYKPPKALKQFLDDSYDSLEWTTVSPSFKITTLLKDKNGAQIALSRVKPGGKMPHHRHTADELTVVLEGSFSDEGGIYKKGDFICRDSKHKHKPVVTKDAECICLMVLDAPIEFTGWFTRVLNPLVRRNHAQS